MLFAMTLITMERPMPGISFCEHIKNAIIGEQNEGRDRRVK